jgi:hypothetical protein
MRIVLGIVTLAACYHGAAATRDVNAAWVGHGRGEIEARWGHPAQTEAAGDHQVLVWSHQNLHVELPSGFARFSAAPTHVEGEAAFEPGAIWHTTTSAAAFVAPTGIIARVDGASLRWGPPNDANLHWGTILGVHAGMGRLGDTPTPLPSGDFHVGGMLGPQLGLVGTFTLVAGTGDDGSALGMSAGIAAQYWPMTRLWLRAGPAALLAWDAGFDNGRFRPGVTAAASYAFVKAGTVAVDLCLDISAGPSTAFGLVGIGVGID